MKSRPHINANGEFQSDKYPTCPPGKVPLSVKDPTAQDLLWQYAQRRRLVDAEFADDLELALVNAGYEPHCLCSHEAGDSACPVHPTCAGCGDRVAKLGDVCSNCHGKGFAR